MRRRVVVTGLGVVTSIGDQITDFWQNLLAGVSGVTEITSFDPSTYGRRFGGEVKKYSGDGIVSKAEKKIWGRATQFAVVATHRALVSAELLKNSADCLLSAGVIFGTTFGEAQIIEAATRDSVASLVRGELPKLKGYHLNQYNPNSISVNVAKKFGCGGVNLVIPTACAAGNYAIAYAAATIASGNADIVIAGGADPFSHVSFSGFLRLGVMAKEKCQPFDLNREGMMVGEGAAVLVLESYENAKARGVKILAEIAGSGFSCDANHMTIPEVGGVTAVIEKALKNASLAYKDIDYICAHGTGTRINDKTESEAIIKLFYDRGHPVPVSSIKSMLGHTMGAASAIEAVACVLAINFGRIPPTINYQTPDPECSIDCVPNYARNLPVRTALNNSFAFGGNNCTVIFSKAA